MILLQGLLLLVTALHADITPAQEVQGGTLRGSVYDFDLQVPLAQVRVSIVEALLTTVSSDAGMFVFENVPPGVYTVSFVKSGYDRQVRSDVLVTAGELTDLRVEMAAEVIEMEELVVTGADLLAGTEFEALDIRAESVSLQDAISAELITKAGVTDVSGALRLVVGASVVEGKYATVRGLSDRYTGTTLNSIRVPSADPRKRAVQIDLFPTGTLDSVTVTKTFTPDLQGDFTGGGVDIVTKSFPDQPILSVKLGFEHDSNATGNSDFLTYRGGGVDTLGRAGSDRDLPAEAAILENPDLPSLGSINFSPNPSERDMKAALAYDLATESFAPAMGVETTEPGLNPRLSIVGGNRYDVGGDDLVGFIAALTYRTENDFYQDGENNTVGISGIGGGEANVAVTRRSDSKGTEGVLIGGLASAFWEPNEGNSLALKLIANQSAEDIARFQVGPTANNQLEQNQTLHYVERDVASAQLLWNRVSDRWTLDGYGAYNTTSQYEPDVRFFRNDFDPDTGRSSPPFGTGSATAADNTRRIWRDGTEDNYQIGADLVFPFTQWTDSEGQVKGGLRTDRTDREYDQSSFFYDFALPQFGYPFQPGAICNFDKGLGYTASPRGDLWTDVFTDDDRVGLAPEEVFCDFFLDFGITDPQPTPAANQLLWVVRPLKNDIPYTGEQNIDAAYGMTELPLSQNFELIFGARYETTDISILPESDRDDGKVRIIVETSPGNFAIEEVPAEEAAADIDEGDLLPSAGIAWELQPAMNLRGSWSQTIARPTFRELAPVATQEFLLGESFTGNPDLQLSHVTNYDLRWEWFYQPGEVLAASVFYKDIEDPIEFVSFTTSGERVFVQPVNFETGSIQGFEVEARASFGQFADSLEGLGAGFNYTYLDSEVDVPEAFQDPLGLGVEETSRSLQGQPEYIFNFNVTYDNARSGTKLGLFYNLTGETLLTGQAKGEDAVPNVFQEPLGLLNFTFSQRLGRERDWSVTFKAKNILQEDRRSVYRLPDGTEITKTERETPLRLSLGFTWSL
jgi:TonB-dependent receptor